MIELIITIGAPLLFSHFHPPVYFSVFLGLYLLVAFAMLEMFLKIHAWEKEREKIYLGDFTYCANNESHSERKKCLRRYLQKLLYSHRTVILQFNKSICECRKNDYKICK